MSEMVLDASALLALLRNERGAATVAEHLDGALISSVNLAEVVSHYAKLGAGHDDVRAMLSPLPITVVAVDEDLAFEAGMMRPAGEAAGLSLGDRICLSLAKKLGASALTADNAWTPIAKDLGVKIELLL